MRDEKKKDAQFIEKNINDLAASIQRTIIEILMEKLTKAVELNDIKNLVIGGGVAANSGVRNAVLEFASKHDMKAFIPERTFTTDNAAMVAVAGYYRYLDREFCSYDKVPYARVKI